MFIKQRCMLSHPSLYNFQLLTNLHHFHHYYYFLLSLYCSWWYFREEPAIPHHTNKLRHILHNENFIPHPSYSKLFPPTSLCGGSKWCYHEFIVVNASCVRPSLPTAYFLFCAAHPTPLSPVSWNNDNGLYCRSVYDDFACICVLDVFWSFVVMNFSFPPSLTLVLPLSRRQ